MTSLTIGKVAYTLEFASNFGYGKKKFTWFLSKPNYTRDGFWCSDTVWVYTTDDVTICNSYIFRRISLEEFVKFIKSNAQERYKSTY